MSTEARRPFLPALREVERGLSAPLRSRVRILRELEGDLESLTEQLRGRGVPLEEARSRAWEALVPRGSTLRRLDDLHASRRGRLSRRLGGDRLRLLERSALMTAAVSLLVVESLLLVGGGILQVPAAHLVPVLVAGGVLVVALAACACRLWLGGGLPRSWSGAVLGLSGVVLAVGLTVAFVDSYRVVSALETAPGAAGDVVPRWLLRTSGLLSLSLLLALAGALGWFLMTQWLAAVSAAYRQVLGYEPPNAAHGSGPPGSGRAGDS